MNSVWRTVTQFAWFPRRDPKLKRWYWLQWVDLHQTSFTRDVLTVEGIGPRDWTYQAWETVSIKRRGAIDNSELDDLLAQATRAAKETR